MKIFDKVNLTEIFPKFVKQRKTQNIWQIVKKPKNWTKFPKKKGVKNYKNILKFEWKLPKELKIFWEML